MKVPFTRNFKAGPALLSLLVLLAATSPAAAQEDGAQATTVRIIAADGKLAPGAEPEMRAEDALRLFKHMLLVRMLDERLTLLQRQGRIGFHIGSLGEEAAIVGRAAALGEADWELARAKREADVARACTAAVSAAVARNEASAASPRPTALVSAICLMPAVMKPPYPFHSGVGVVITWITRSPGISRSNPSNSSL